MSGRVLSESEEAFAAAIEASGGLRAREDAAGLRKAGLPSRRDEDWRWSDLRGALAGRARPAARAHGKGVGDGVLALLARYFGETESFAIEPSGVRRLITRVNGAEDGFQYVSINIGAGAVCERIVLVSEGDGVCLNRAEVSIGPGGVFRQWTLSEGTSFARLETAVQLSGAGASASMNAVYLSAGGRKTDIVTDVAHGVGACESGQLVKGVAGKAGQGVFQGRIVVDAGAQGTQARQRHQAVLLEEGGEIFAKPELYIHADDVQCAHGNSIGVLDQEAIFYLRSRGVDEARAVALLTEAFLADALPAWLDEAITEESLRLVSAWLARRGRP